MASAERVESGTGLVTRRFATAGSMRAVGMVATVALALLLTDALGPEGFGRYATVVATANMVAVLATLGLGRFCIAEIPKLKDRRDDPKVDELVAETLSIIAVVAPLVGVVVGLSTAALAGARLGLAVGLLSAALILTHYGSSVLRSLGSVRFADATNGALGGAATQVVALAVTAIATAVDRISVVVAVAAQAASVAVVVAGFAWLLRGHVASFRLRIPEGVTLRRSMPFGVVQASSIVPADLWAASLVLTPEVVGFYALARRLAALVSTPLQVANVATVRELSAALGVDHRRAQSLTRRTARMAAALSAVPLVLMWLFAEPVLRIGFGEVYVASRPALLVLSLGVAANVLAGPCGVVLSMAGNAARVAAASVAAAVVTLVVGIVMADRFGAVGLAATVALVTAAKFAALAWSALRRVGIWSLPIGGPSSGPTGDRLRSELR